MSNPKLERAIALSSRIKDKREELASLEAEFEHLMKAPSDSPNRVGLPRNKVKIVRLLKKSTEPVQLQEIISHIGLSQSATNSLLRQLIKAGEVQRVGYGIYTLKS